MGSIELSLGWVDRVTCSFVLVNSCLGDLTLNSFLKVKWITGLMDYMAADALRTLREDVFHVTSFTIEIVPDSRLLHSCAKRSSRLKVLVRICM